MEKRSFRSVPARLALLALAMLGAALLSLCLGAAAVSPREILSVLSGGALDRVFGVRVRRVPVDGGWQYFCE